MNVREYLDNNILIFDGAMGTYFASKYKETYDKCELANIENSSLVYDIHREYIDAGCKAIKTNTFAANLSEIKDEELLENVISKGWEIAVRAAGDEVFIFADIGPIQSTDEKRIKENILHYSF